MAQREAPKAAAPGGGNDGGGGHAVDLEMSGGGRERGAEAPQRSAWAAAVGVAGVGLAGAGVLVWWAVAFHPARQQLWMVPVGLVLLGTPLVAWLSLFASGAARCLGRRLGSAGAQRPPVVILPER
ncbi:hypothetical protein HU200_001581 [Digitaria exilis]|uniref:Uncharacterized protein n=1 Tax=Digitaria exilis TaxID=1010633 RepID=A0A835FYH5_9POAL|nr:hypothetical protein HU200_001581 [Digitaria exilis]